MSKPIYTLVAEIEPHYGATHEPIKLDLVDEFEWSVTRSGEDITLSLGSGENQKSEVHKTTGIRDFILENYNWNGIVNLIESMEKEDEEFEYTRPLNLTGIADNDDPLIIPDEALESVIRLQAKYQIEEKHSENPEEKIDDILKAVDGKPKKSFAENVLGTTYKDLLKESDNSDMEYDGKSFAMPNIETSDEATIYNFLKNLTLSRNGLWSDEDEVTNFISIRRALESSSSKYNDTLFVAWMRDGQKKAVQYIGSTEPGKIGDTKDGKLLPQTMTMLLGTHQGRTSKKITVGGRTRNAFRKSRGSSSEYFHKGDTSMNIHYGHPNINGLPTSYGFHNNSNGSGYDSSQLEAYLTLVEVNYILTQWGAGKNSISAYDNLIKQSKDYTLGEVRGTTDDTKKVDIKDGEGKVAKTLNYKDYKSYIDSTYSNNNKKNDAIAILEDYNSEGDYSEKTISELRTELKNQYVWKHVLDIQMNYEADISRVDGKPGTGTIGKITKADDEKTKARDEYNELKTKAITDLETINNLFITWDSNSVLTANLKKTFKEDIKLKKEDFDASTATDVDNLGGKGMEKEVKGWSQGCQIVYGGQNYYQFLNNLTQFVTNTNQERWYYTIVDMSSVSVVAQGTPIPAETIKK